MVSLQGEARDELPDRFGAIQTLEILQNDENIIATLVRICFSTP